MSFTTEPDGSTSDIKVLDLSPKDTEYSFDIISLKNIEALRYKRIDNSVGQRTPNIIKILTYEIAK